MDNNQTNEPEITIETEGGMSSLDDGEEEEKTPSYQQREQEDATPDEPYYVVATGRKPSDTGIYRTWTEAQQRTQGVSGADHKRCDNLEEAIDYLRAANINESIINSYRQIETTEPDNNRPRRRTTRQQETKNYKEMNSGGRPNQAKKDDKETPLKKELEWTKKELNKINQRENKLLENNVRLEEKIDIMRIQMEESEEQETKYEKEIEHLNKSITEMAHQNKDLTEQNKKLKTQLETIKKNTPPANPTTRKTISFIADSNRKHITRHLQGHLQEHNVIENTDIYQTRDLMDLILPSLPKTDLTIVMMGTNDVRLGRGGAAMDNLSEIAKQTDQNRIIMIQIPPIELGNKGEEQYEDAQADRTILNRLISRKFRHNVNLTEFNVEHSKQSVLDKDGYHLLEKGGKMLAAAIAETTKELVNTPDNPRNENPTSRITNRENPIPEDITTELEIPPGIGRHVVGKQGKKKSMKYKQQIRSLSAPASQINSMKPN